MHKKRIVWYLAPALVAAVMAACSDKEPATPTNPTPIEGDATLKAPAPAAVSPRDVVAESRTPTLVINNVSGEFASAPMSYRFQVKNAAGALVEEGVSEAGANGRTSYTLRNRLDVDQQYTWTARSEYQGAYGPWSARASFTSPKVSDGYLRGNEVYDPLVEGKSVGRVVGAHTWLPGQGIRLDTMNSYIEYKLERTCSSCEFSMIVSNVDGGTSDDKSKVMSMREGLADLVANDRRMTVELRRGGIIAWRFITHDVQIDTGSRERVRLDLSDENTYLWTARWDGVFKVSVKKLPDFAHVYDHGKPYPDTYDPVPHYAYVGSPQSGAGHGTIPGVIVRQVWLSPDPRPDWARE